MSVLQVKEIIIIIIINNNEKVIEVESSYLGK